MLTVVGRRLTVPREQGLWFSPAAEVDSQSWQQTTRHARVQEIPVRLALRRSRRYWPVRRRKPQREPTNGAGIPKKERFLESVSASERDTGEPVVLNLMADYEGRHPILDCQIVELIFSDRRPGQVSFQH